MENIQISPDKNRVTIHGIEYHFNTDVNEDTICHECHLYEKCVELQETVENEFPFPCGEDRDDNQFGNFKLKNYMNNIYEITSGDEDYHVAASTAIEALKTLISLNDSSLSDFEAEDDIKLLSDEEMKEKTVVDHENEGAKISLFDFSRQFITQYKPEVIASSLWVDE